MKCVTRYWWWSQVMCSTWWNTGRHFCCFSNILMRLDSRGNYDSYCVALTMIYDLSLDKAMSCASYSSSVHWQLVKHIVGVCVSCDVWKHVYSNTYYTYCSLLDMLWMKTSGQLTGGHACDTVMSTNRVDAAEIGNFKRSQMESVEIMFIVCCLL